MPRRSASRTSSPSTWAAPRPNARWSRTAASRSTSVYYAGGYVKGFPIKSPVIDIVEVGSGGGSIAWLDPQNRLHVGPQSAGSTPGPVCYGAAAREPTVTDANLVLGRLNAERFLGGELALDAAAARTAIERIAEPLGYAGAQRHRSRWPTASCRSRR